MSIIHFLNVLQGDCNIIEHDNSKRITVIDVCNADSDGIYENAISREHIYEDISDSTTGNYGQKKHPENPINYLKRLNINNIFRFIITHPDMDHIDGIRDLFADITVDFVWDTANTKEISNFSKFGGFNQHDWEFYQKLRDKKLDYTILQLYAEKNNPGNYWTEDNIKILCPTEALVDNANMTKDFNDASYVILFTPPIANTGKHWKILFGGDSDDKSWDYIMNNFIDDVSDIDVLFAPHHGRDSNRDFDFVKVLNPKITLFGNASSKHLAYNKYSEHKLTNNQAGTVIIDCSDKLYFYVKNEKFRNDYWNKKGWENPPSKNITHDAFFIFNIPPSK